MDFKSYIMENALVLIPVLNIIGVMIKGTKKIKSSYIPLILLVCGIVGAVALMGWSGESFIQGILVAGASVYGHQLVSQGKKCMTDKTESSAVQAPAPDEQQEE